MELEMLFEIVSQVMKVDPREVKPETTFVEDLGADSLDLLRIVMNIEEQFNIKLNRDDFMKITTVNDALTMIKKVKKA